MHVGMEIFNGEFHPDKMLLDGTGGNFLILCSMELVFV